MKAPLLILRRSINNPNSNTGSESLANTFWTSVITETALELGHQNMGAGNSKKLMVFLNASKADIICLLKNFMINPEHSLANTALLQSRVRLKIINVNSPGPSSNSGSIGGDSNSADHGASRFNNRPAAATVEHNRRSRITVAETIINNFCQVNGHVDASGKWILEPKPVTVVPWSNATVAPENEVQISNMKRRCDGTCNFFKRDEANPFSVRSFAPSKLNGGQLITDMDELKDLTSKEFVCSTQPLTAHYVSGMHGENVCDCNLGGINLNMRVCMGSSEYQSLKSRIIEETRDQVHSMCKIVAGSVQATLLDMNRECSYVARMETRIPAEDVIWKSARNFKGIFSTPAVGYTPRGTFRDVYINSGNAVYLRDHRDAAFIMSCPPYVAKHCGENLYSKMKAANPRLLMKLILNSIVQAFASFDIELETLGVPSHVLPALLDLMLNSMKANKLTENNKDSFILVVYILKYLLFEDGLGISAGEVAISLGAAATVDNEVDNPSDNVAAEDQDDEEDAEDDEDVAESNSDDVIAADETVMNANASPTANMEGRRPAAILNPVTLVNVMDAAEAVEIKQKSLALKLPVRKKTMLNVAKLIGKGKTRLRFEETAAPGSANYKYRLDVQMRAVLEKVYNRYNDVHVITSDIYVQRCLHAIHNIVGFVKVQILRFFGKQEFFAAPNQDDCTVVNVNIVAGTVSTAAEAATVYEALAYMKRHSNVLKHQLQMIEPVLFDPANPGDPVPSGSLNSFNSEHYEDVVETMENSRKLYQLNALNEYLLLVDNNVVIEDPVLSNSTSITAENVELVVERLFDIIMESTFTKRLENGKFSKSSFYYYGLKNLPFNRIISMNMILNDYSKSGYVIIPFTGEGEKESFSDGKYLDSSFELVRLVAFRIHKALGGSRKLQFFENASKLTIFNFFGKFVRSQDEQQERLYLRTISKNDRPDDAALNQRVNYRMLYHKHLTQSHPEMFFTKINRNNPEALQEYARYTGKTLPENTDSLLKHGGNYEYDGCLSFCL